MDSQVGGVQEMPGALPDWYPQYGFRARRNCGSKGKRPQLVIGPQQHGNGKTRDVSRQQEIHQVTHPSGKGKWTPVGSCVNQFEQKLHTVGSRQSYQRLCPGLLEAQVDMANDIENRDSCGKAPQCCQAGHFTAILRGHHSTLLPLTTSYLSSLLSEARHAGPLQRCFQFLPFISAERSQARRAVAEMLSISTASWRNGFQ